MSKLPVVQARILPTDKSLLLFLDFNWLFVVLVLFILIILKRGMDICFKLSHTAVMVVKLSDGILQGSNNKFSHANPYSELHSIVYNARSCPLIFPPEEGKIYGDISN